MKWRLIESAPSDAPNNMAIDEALFCAQARNPEFTPTLRVYTWNKPCVTIGYFQKYTEFTQSSLPVVRRLTGGLSVAHGNDISYALIANHVAWKSVYDQEKTYESIHAVIKEALSLSGIETDFVSPAEENYRNAGGNLCVKTLYRHDLKSGARKILGSCQRRRGSNLLVQGSIHLPHAVETTRFCCNLRLSLKKYTGCAVESGSLSADESASAQALAETKYQSLAWNNKL